MPIFISIVTYWKSHVLNEYSYTTYILVAYILRENELFKDSIITCCGVGFVTWLRKHR